jgi:outer membrane lipoprotein-sorting protein
MPTFNLRGYAGRKPLVLFATTLAFAAALLLQSVAWAQNGANLMPAESTAKARSIMQQAIETLGGDKYLRLRDADCTARLAGFEKSGAIGGLGEVRVLRQLPDKNRTEYDKRGEIVTVYAGDKGWTLDRSGVEDLPASDIMNYQEQLKNDTNFILRYRLNDPDLTFRYGGTEVVDLKQVDWVEAGDKQGHTMRMAFDRNSHYPVRFILQERDREGTRIETTTVYSNYRPVDGIQMPFQISRFRNGLQVSQVFYTACKYNTSVPDELFTRVSLDKHFSGKK